MFAPKSKGAAMPETVGISKGGSVDKRKMLENHPLFFGLPSELIERLSSYAALKNVRRGVTIFAKGDGGTSLFAVCKGSVKITSPSADGKDALFNLVTEGEIFGEIALLDGRPRTADAVAVTDCQLMIIDRSDFLPLVHSQPELAIKIIDVLCARLRHTSEQVEDVIFLDLPGRLAKALLRLAQAAARPTSEDRLRITQKEIGEMIGISRESTNKQLREWQAKKWISLERGSVSILKPEALTVIARLDE
jgi:CRP/FNR family cyclic AMP-dependent transcriptional regulator